MYQQDGGQNFSPSPLIDLKYWESAGSNFFFFWFWGATDSKKKFKAGKAQQKFRSTTKTFTTHKKEIQHTKKVSTLKFFNAQQKIHHTKKFQRTTNFNTHTHTKINAQQNISPHKKKLRHTQTNKKFTTK